MGTNGLLSFKTPYNSFSNQQFPGSTTISSRYLVAPFWDDVDIVGGNGEISYEIHQSGYYLDEVNAFLQRKRPSEFEGTWMAVVYYDAVHPYIGSSNPEVYKSTYNSLILIFIYFIGKYFPSNPDYRWNILLCHLHICVWSYGVGHWGYYRLQCCRKPIQKL